MAAFTWVPSYSSAVDHEPSVFKNMFGDGYAQRIGDGLNADGQVWRLVFLNVANSVANAIENFIVARAGVEVFDWTPPGGTPANFICEEGCSRAFTGFAASTLTMTFKQDFAPA